jgi:CRISPR-associated protein Csb2
VTVDMLDDPVQPPMWMKVHVPRDQRRGQTNEDKRAHRLRLTFSEPVSGPIFLGHSSHYGLGLFAAVPS